MAQKEQLEALAAAIEHKSTELDGIRKKKAGAADDPAGLVLLEKQEQRAAAQLEALEKAKTAAEYTPPAPSDLDELLAPVRKYYTAKTVKADKARANVLAAENELHSLDTDLQAAAEACDAAKTVELSARRDDVEARLKYLREMQTRVNALPVFPSGAIVEEWEAVCDSVSDDWNAAALRCEVLAAEYKAACADMMRMRDTLMQARDEMGRMAARDHQSVRFYPILTRDLDGHKLVLNKGDYIELLSISTPLMGTAL